MQFAPYLKPFLPGDTGRGGARELRAGLSFAAVEGDPDESDDREVPARIVGHIRSGLYTELDAVGRAFIAMAATPVEERAGRWHGEPLTRLDRIAALLDVLGWTPTGPPAAATIDLGRHSWTLLDALDSELDRCHSTLEQARGESPSRSQRRRLQRRVGELGELMRTVHAQGLAAGAIACVAPCPVHAPAVFLVNQGMAPARFGPRRGRTRKERLVLPMSDERTGSEPLGEEVAERAIVLQVLRDDHDERWSRAELEREIYDIQPLDIGDALECLRQAGVVHLSGEQVWASRCARHLDELGMVSI